MKARMAALVALLALTGLSSALLHEGLHCAGTGQTPWACGYTVHYHGGLDHVAHSSHYTPGDHAWIIPAQIVYMLAAFVGLVFLMRPRPTTA